MEQDLPDACLEQDLAVIVAWAQPCTSEAERMFTNEDHKMKTTVIALALAAAVAFPSAAVAAASTDFSGAKSAYATKKAECKAKAKAKRFGVHWIKRNRWIKDCIAGAH